jgi:uncharacterized protein YjbI with pentapeptide repeats
LEWASWNNVKEGLIQFEKKLSQYEIKTIEGFEKFQKNHPVLDEIVKETIPFLPPPVNGIIQRIYKKSNGDEVQSSKEIFEFLKKIDTLGESHYKSIVTELHDIQIDMAKESTLKQIQITLVSTGHDLTSQLSILKSLGQKLIDIEKKQDNTTEILLRIEKEVSEIVHNTSQGVTEPNDFIKNPLFESKTYANITFDEQILAFKNQVCAEYQNYPLHRPLILNFTKLRNGGNTFVKQHYFDKKTHEEGDDIFSYVISTLEKNISEIKEIHELEQKVNEVQEFQADFNFDDKLWKIINNPSIVTDKFQLLRAIRENYGLTIEIIGILQDKVLLDDNIRQEIKIKTQKEKSENKIDEYNHLDEEVEKIKQEKKSFEETLDDKITSSTIIYRDNKLSEFSTKIIELQNKQKSLIPLINIFYEQIENDRKRLENIVKDKQKLKKIQELISNFDGEVNSKIEQSNRTYLEVNEYLQNRQKNVLLDSKLKKLTLEKLIPIIGEYGSGKSALCNHIMNYLCDENFHGPDPIFVPLGELPKYSDIDLREEIYDYIVSEYHFNLDKSEFYTKIENGELIFVLDALDEMSYKLDTDIGQRNLERVINLAKKATVLLTSRHTYLSNTMTKYLFEYDRLIEVLDFTMEEIEEFLGFRLKNETEVERIMKVIREDKKIFDLAKKPLFLNVINEHFDEINNYRIINESIMLTIFTNQWLEHDAKVKRQTIESEKIRLIEIRKQISEILAFAKTGINETISIDDVKDTVKDELGKYHSDVLEKLEEYYHDAITSTFLVKEENESYRFLSNPIREFFIARRIVSDINNNDPVALLKHSKKISSEVIFIFIKGLIESEWSIQPHALNDLIQFITKLSESEDKSNNSQFLDLMHEEQKYVEKHENKSYVILETIRNIQKTSSKENVGNLLRILAMTGNLPPKTNLSNLNFSNSNLGSTNFVGANLTNCDFNHSFLRGCNFSHAILVNADFSNSDLSGSNFEKTILTKTIFNTADLNNANLQHQDLSYTDFSNANLSYSNLENVRLKNTKFRGTIFSSAKLGKMDLRHMPLQHTVFLQTDLSQVSLSDANLTSADFRGNDLSRMNFKDTILVRAKFNGANLSSAVLFHAKCHYAIFSGSNLDDTDITKTEFNGVNTLPISTDEAITRGALF